MFFFFHKIFVLHFSLADDHRVTLGWKGQGSNASRPQEQAKLGPLSQPVSVEVHLGTHLVPISTCEEGKDYFHQLKGPSY